MSKNPHARKSYFLDLRMPNPTPNQIERNAIQDIITKDISNLFRLQKAM